MFYFIDYNSWLWTVLWWWYVFSVTVWEVLGVLYLYNNWEKLKYIPERDEHMGPYRMPDRKTSFQLIWPCILTPIFLAPIRNTIFPLSILSIVISKIGMIGADREAPLPYWRRFVIKRSLLHIL
jgi:hypothetical protein